MSKYKILLYLFFYGCYGCCGCCSSNKVEHSIQINNDWTTNNHTSVASITYTGEW